MSQENICKQIKINHYIEDSVPQGGNGQKSKLVTFQLVKAIDDP